MVIGWITASQIAIFFLRLMLVLFDNINECYTMVIRQLSVLIIPAIETTDNGKLPKQS